MQTMVHVQKDAVVPQVNTVVKISKKNMVGAIKIHNKKNYPTNKIEIK